MLLTAHRVRSASGAEGLNAFCYMHGSLLWVEPPPGVPDEDPGHLANEKVTMPPGGNRVRSYLDIITPDETPTSEIIGSVRPFLRVARSHPLPWSETIGRCTFRFGLERGLESQWSEEFRALLEAALRVRVPW